MYMKIICFSDAHLLLHSSLEEEKKLTLLDEFLDYIKQEKPDQLIIAGDLFDVWFEYKLVIPKPYFKVLHQLATISDLGIKIVYLVGNHDFKFIDFFNKYLPAEIFLDPYEIDDIGGKKYLFSHGDEYTTNDLRYHLLKSILRNKFVSSLFSMIHPDIGLKLGKLFSRSSKKKQDSSSKIDRLETGLIEFAQEKINQGYNYIIMGHIHQPKSIKLGTGYYINLGDWIQHYSYLLIDEKGPRLKYWEKQSIEK